MNMNEQLGRSIIIIGVLFIIVGLLFTFLLKITSLLKLPGDIYIKKDNFIFYFPWVTSLLISAILSLLYYLLFRK